MEATPSPQSVGREFVRQYYTLLNKAPTHLHRFYNHHSSFIHGGLDPPNRETSPVIGQKQIHQKIQQLNFRDCHAKITQVDSQATLGKGVVVQVTGELSNVGQPMRRFTQTFVLAAQSPKKYYVHNDIFRYQDEIISDEECEAENRSEPEDEVSQECPVLDVQPMTQTPIQYYNPNSTTLPSNIAPVHHQPPHVLTSQTVPTVNGAVHPEDIAVLPGPVTSHINPGQGQVLPNPVSNLPSPLVQPVLNATVPVEETSPSVNTSNEETCEINNYNSTSEPELENQDLSAEPAISTNEPRTYANLLKSGNALPFNVNANITTGLSHPTGSTSPPSVTAREQAINNRNINRGPRPNQTSQRPPKQDSNRGSSGRNTFNEDEDKKRPQGNNDTNQLFLGNLPHTATEDELREIFSEFGTIVELRVLSKPNKTTPPGTRTPPNYGFITYETQIEVQSCLAAKPIYFPKDDKNGVILNIEEKKIKDRPVYGNNRPNNENRPRENGPRRSGGGPGGMGGGPNRNQSGGGGTGGPNPASGGVNQARTNSYNRGGGGPGSNRGPNAPYTNRR